MKVKILIPEKLKNNINKIQFGLLAQVGAEQQ